MSDVATWLETKYLDWQRQIGRRPVTEFARYLGVNGALLSQWMKGTRQPGRRKAPVLAAKLGPEIYDLLGLARPDSDLREINLVWGQLSKEQRREAVRRVKELAEKGYRGEIT